MYIKPHQITSFKKNIFGEHAPEPDSMGADDICPYEITHLVSEFIQNIH